jgi:hypothetical protein
LHLSEIKFPAGVKATNEHDVIVATVKEIVETAATATVEGEAAEPELIGRKPAEGEEAAAAGEEAKK